MKRILPLFLLIALVLNGCSSVAKSTPAAPAKPVATLVPLGTPSAKYGSEVARPLISDFVNIGPREAGTTGETQAAQYISSVFTALGYAPENQPFTGEAGNKSISSANVVAVKKGASAQEIIVGAHYDSTAAGPGADDNASGVAVMLEVAKLVQNMTTPYTIRFIAFGAAESGLLGSYAYLNQMSQEDFENIIAMLDLDSLVAGDHAYIFSDEGQLSTVRNWALEWATGNGLDLQTTQNADLTDPATGNSSSDFAPFRDAGIPFAYFVSTDLTLGDKKGTTQVDPRYGENGVIRNTKYDTLAYLDSTFPGRVDTNLNLFISVLYNILTQYEAPDSMKTTEFEWVKEFAGAVIVTDPDGMITGMNDKAAKSHEEDGGRALIGKNMLDCHPEPARTKLVELMKKRQTNIYTIEKQAVKKLIYQSPWYQNGEYAGIIEISLEIPFDMPHFIRS